MINLLTQIIFYILVTVTTVLLLISIRTRFSTYDNRFNWRVTILLAICFYLLKITFPIIK